MKAISRARLTGGVVLSAVAFGLAVTALGTAGSANASCASLNGHNIGQGCKSTVGSVSVGLGKDAQATSWGPATSPSPSATPATTRFYNPTSPTLAYAKGTGNVSVALGDGSLAGTLGTGNRAFVIGQGSNAFSYGGDTDSVRIPPPEQSQHVGDHRRLQ